MKENSDKHLAYIENKIFLKNEEAFYLTRIFHSKSNTDFAYALLKPKITGKSKIYDKYPIVAVLKIDGTANLEDKTKDAKDFKFIEWAYIKPMKPNIL